MSKDEVRCVKSVRSQVTVGELYRWILAKLSDKDIKRALHKYRDLMPRQSDWNRKLTQATNVPELGFRYLYRCGQIDETNHRTMQKMLKYIDRQDVLPYFDTILYNTNNSNASIEQLRNGLLDKVTNFLSLCDMDGFNEVFESPYTISQCQPMTNLRLTRSVRKRLSTGDCSSCLTFVKKPRLDSTSSMKLSPDDSDSIKTSSNSPNLLCNESKFWKDMTYEHFAARVLTCLKQSRQRYRNITLLNSYSLPGVIEAPIQLLLHSNNCTAKKNSQNGKSRLSTNIDSDDIDADDKVFDNLKDVYSKQKESDLAPGFFYAKIRVRIRMDSGIYLDDIDNLTSTRTELLDRQMDIITQTSGFLRDREAGEMICELRCTDLDQVECLWWDYQTGMLKKRLSDILLAAPESNATHFNERVPYIGGVIMPNLKLHIFISRHEYESCRAILMRNLSPVYVYRQPSNSTKNASFVPNNNNNGNSTNTANSVNTPNQGPSTANGAPHHQHNNNNNTNNINTNLAWNRNGALNHDNNNNTNQSYTGTNVPQRFSAVQHLIAHLREVPQMNMWSIGQPQISVANRPVLMHMFYPQESYIPITVNPLLRPIHLMSPPFNNVNVQSTSSRTNQ